MRDLKTHQMGATNMHETRYTESPQQIDPPVVPNPGQVDMRTVDIHKTESEKNED